jgi:thiol-disulfide isomerase/thioredoxin
MSVILAAAAFVLSLCSAVSAETFPSFTSRTLDGEPITSAVFSKKKLTMVNMWATWCPPCVAEMPDLARLGKSMPEGSQLVGIMFDVSTEDDSDRNAAESILGDAGAGFTQILYDPSMYDYLSTIDAIPTTVFVDSKGNIVGEPMVGSDSEKNYRSAIEAMLKRL